MARRTDPHSLTARIPGDKPDAMVWTEGGAAFYLCAHCADTGRVESRRAGDAAYRAANAHLWRTHTIRRTWIEDRKPHTEAHVQLGFDLALQHQRHF